ncbi:MAG: hypothetical protein KIT73_05940 [Burkholderiales bacterium]|nr:hypothetical protein [Burkholderiales bacterium]
MLADALPFLAFGFVLGMRHATDADHVVAVSTIVGRSQTIRSAAMIGATWGIGHTLTILVVGGAIVLLNLVIPPRVGLAMEFAVALMLIVLGILTLTGWLDRASRALAVVADRARATAAPEYRAVPTTGHRHGLFGLHPPGGADAHAHVHIHGDYVHTHRHGHVPDSHGHAEDATPPARLDRWFGELTLYQWLRPLVIGIVHGLAGSAASALMLVAEIHSGLGALLYLLLFGAGTVAGMMLITGLIAIPFAASARRLPRLNDTLRIASGVLSLCFGLWLAWNIGFVDGLFAADPRWDPH